MSNNSIKSSKTINHRLNKEIEEEVLVELYNDAKVQEMYADEDVRDIIDNMLEEGELK